MKWSSVSYRLVNLFHFRWIFKASRRIAYDYVSIGLSRDWSLKSNRPRFYKRETQLYSWYYTAKENGPYWLDAGFKSMEVMKKGDYVLDISTGDGFFPFMFYRFIASKIDAIDLDEDALAHARENYADPMLQFSKCNIVNDNFPGKGYDVVLWHNAMDFVTLDEQMVAIQKAIDSSKSSMVLFGSVFLQLDPNYASNDGHKKSAFFSEQELRSHLSKKFNTVEIVLADHLHRKIFYFTCRGPKR